MIAETIRAELGSAAHNYATVKDLPSWERLCKAALAYGQASEPLKKEYQRKSRGGDDTERVHLVPFGKDKGKALGDCNTKNLEWLHGIIQQSVTDPTKAKWKANNQRLAAAISAELEAR